jgi:hypothetical protein
MQSSPLPCYLVPLGPKYPPQHPILEKPQPTFLPHCERSSFTPIQNNRQDYSSVCLNQRVTRRQKVHTFSKNINSISKFMASNCGYKQAPYIRRHGTNVCSPGHTKPEVCTLLPQTTGCNHGESSSLEGKKDLIYMNLHVFHVSK